MRTACKLYEENKFDFISIRHYRTMIELYQCDNKEDYTKFMCDNFLLSEDEEYFINKKGQITLIFYVL
tara:strand:- start:150 stop:353 length:204 start_codon:yes stop_codon:yes gene_type:complete